MNSRHNWSQTQQGKMKKKLLYITLDTSKANFFIDHYRELPIKHFARVDPKIFYVDTLRLTWNPVENHWSRVMDMTVEISGKTRDFTTPCRAGSPDRRRLLIRWTRMSDGQGCVMAPMQQTLTLVIYPYLERIILNGNVNSVHLSVVYVSVRRC